MSNYYDSEIDSLEEQLDEFLNDAKKFLGEVGTVEDTIKELLLLDTSNSKELAKYILDTQNEIQNILDSYNDSEENDDPFLYLRNDDDEN